MHVRRSLDSTPGYDINLLNGILSMQKLCSPIEWGYGCNTYKLQC